jgi:hypothetical protein
MAYDRFTASVTPESLLEFAVAPGEALVLAEVFRPRGHQKRFEVDIGLFDVAEDAPA